MSEENNENLGDEIKDGANDMANEANEAAKDISEETKNTADEINEGANDMASETNEAAKDISEEAKSTADEFKEGWNEATKGGENKKMLAGILGIVLGGFGAHKFVLGYNKEGFILLGTLLISIPLMCIIIGAITMYIPIIVGLIEGIIYLTKSDEEFYETYQANKKPWF